MKRYRLVLVLLFAGFAFSCKSTAEGRDAPPPPESTLPPVPVIEDPGEDAGEESAPGLTGETALPEPSVPDPGNPEEAPLAGEIPSETPFAGEPALGVMDALPEPFADLPETEAEESPPGEEPFAAALPDPAEPILPEPPVAAEVPPQPPEPQPFPLPVPSAPPQSPQPAPVPAPVPPPVPPPPPPASVPDRPAGVSSVPPPFIRPAEEAPAPAPVREPVPLPPTPPVEPPAWTRQNQAESSSQAAPVLPAEPSPAAEDGGIHFSRVVRATVGQLVEIPFRGIGWVYLGEMGFRQGLVYGSRRLDPEGQSFIFRAEAAGTYGLKFYKQDFVRDYILNDYVQVIVGESPEAAATGWFNPVTDRGRAIAEPRWPTAAQEAEAFRDRDGAGGTNRAGETGRSAAPGQAPAAESRPVRDTGPARDTAVPGQSAAFPERSAPPPASPDVAAPPAPAPQIAGGRDTSPQVPAAGPARSADRPGQSGAAPAVPVAAVPVPAPGEALPDGSPPPGGGSPPAGGASEAEAASPDLYLGRAREEFEAGRVAQALAILDRFRESFPAGSDETWWLYGQFYEANSPSRDIRSSLDYYRRLLREYPQSSRCNEARRRIAYLERYYINIR